MSYWIITIILEMVYQVSGWQKYLCPWVFTTDSWYLRVFVICE